jgi:hypothetical protein
VIELVLVGTTLLAAVAHGQAGPAPPLKWRERLTLEGQEPRGSPGILAAALAPDGTVAVTGHEDGTIRAWDARTAKALAPPQKGADRIQAIAFARDGKTFLVADAKGVKRFDTTTLKPVRGLAWKLPEVQGIALAPEGELAAVACPEGVVQLWPLDRDGAEPVRLQAHPDGVSAVAFAPDGKTLATGGADGRVKVWDVPTRKERASLRPRPARVRALGFAADGKLLASAHGRQGVSIWDLGAGKERRPLKGRTLTYVAVALSKDGRTVAAGAANGTLRIWDLSTGEVVHSFKPHAGLVHGVVFSADGKTLASASTDATARLWRPEGSVAEAPQETMRTPREMELLLQDLRAADSARALQAVQTLAGTPRQTIALLKKVLRPTEPVPADQIARLLEELDSSQYAVRSKANRELERYVDRARSQLTKALAAGVPLEVRRRILGLLQRLDKQDTPELTFQRRAVEVLEKIAAREARALLMVLAGGVPEAYLTRYAQEALKRLDE